MNLKKYLSSGILGFAMLFAAMPARAGIPVFDATAIAQQIQQVVAWGQQYQQMVDQITRLQQQYQQLQTMTATLDGGRGLGTILQNPLIANQLTPEFRNAAALLLNPTATSVSLANITATLAAFGVDTTLDPQAGRSAADGFGRAQSILASAETRAAQLQALATQVNTAPDAKSSLDLMNRNVLETANINNQMLQTMAALEASKQAEQLRLAARQQNLANQISAGLATPAAVRTY